MHDAFRRFRRGPARIHAQFAAGLLKRFRQQRVQLVARQAQRRRGQWADGRPVGTADEHRRAGWNRAGLLTARQQAEPFEHGLPAAADEFAADPVPRIAPGLPDRHRHAALPQADAQSQSRQSAANDGDGFAASGMIQSFRRAMNRWLNSPAGCSVNRQFCLVRPERGKFAAGKSGADADVRIMAGDRAAADHPQQPAAKPRPATSAAVRAR